MKLKYTFLFSFALSLVLIFYLASFSPSRVADEFSRRIRRINEEPNINSSSYLVDTPKCKILDVNPFDSQVKPYHKRLDYLPCTDREMLTYVTKEDNVATIHVNTKNLQSYKPKEINCYYREVHRRIKTSDPDRSIRLSEVKHFENNVTVGNRPVMVACRTAAGVIYENVHAPVTVTEEVKKKQELTDSKNFFSALIIGIDSVSRLNFIRCLPNSHKFLMDNEWISFKGYNKIDDNTYPNIMAILTGNRQIHHKCYTHLSTGLNNCEMLWYNFSDLGYITAYAEDETDLSTFNLHKKGFLKPPTDYYFRPYFVASELLKQLKFEGLAYCTGPENTGQRVLNVATDFATTFIDHPNFGLFWMNSFSHNTLNTVSMMDDKIKLFLQTLSHKGILENSFVFFLSDHGLRCTDFRCSSMGWLEDRLPFFFLWVPRRFRRQFPQAYANIKSNSRKLITPYDLYATLQHLVVLSGFDFSIQKSADCPKCASLFTDIEHERTCGDAGIDQHWCTCTDYKSVDRDKDSIKKAANAAIYKIHRVIAAWRGSSKCVKFVLHKVIAASVSNRRILVVIETQPKATFEATLDIVKRKNGTDWFRVNGISRIDLYRQHSWCVEGRLLAKYCYCK